MIIQKIVKVLQSLDESQRSAHKKIDSIQIDLQVLLKTLASRGSSTVKEDLKRCNIDELKAAIHDTDQLAVESAQVDHELSVAIYSVLKPKTNLTKDQLIRLKIILESHVVLNVLSIEDKAINVKIERTIHVINLKMKMLSKTQTDDNTVAADYVKPKSKIYKPGVI